MQFSVCKRALLIIMVLSGLLPGYAHAQGVWDGLPSVDAVKQAIQGRSETQTLGRQCAAFSELILIMRNELGQKTRMTAAAKDLLDQYNSAIGQLKSQYAQLHGDEVDHLRQWQVMCMNRQNGETLPGGAALDFGLDQSVSRQELHALLGPWPLQILGNNESYRDNMVRLESEAIERRNQNEQAEAQENRDRQLAQLGSDAQKGIMMLLKYGALFILLVIAIVVGLRLSKKGKSDQSR